MDKIVKLGGRDVRLVPPKSQALRLEVAIAGQEHALRATWAALGMCWQDKHPPKVNLAECKFSLLEYGGRVFDDLSARGLTLQDISEAAVEAFGVATAGLVDTSEVGAVEGFSEAPAGGSTS